MSSQLFQLQPHTGPSDEAAPAHTKLIYPSHLFPVDDELAQEVYDKVIVALEKITRSKRVVINFRNEWKRAQNFTEEEYEEYFKEVSSLRFMPSLGVRFLTTVYQYRSLMTMLPGGNSPSGRPSEMNTKKSLAGRLT